MKVSVDKYFISDNGHLHNGVRVDDKIFHALAVPATVSKYILHQAHDALGDSGTARTYQCLK